MSTRKEILQILPKSTDYIAEFLKWEVTKQNLLLIWIKHYSNFGSSSKKNNQPGKFQSPRSETLGKILANLL